MAADTNVHTQPPFCLCRHGPSGPVPAGDPDFAGHRLRRCCCVRQCRCSGLGVCPFSVERWCCCCHCHRHPAEASVSVTYHALWCTCYIVVLHALVCGSNIYIFQAIPIHIIVSVLSVNMPCVILHHTHTTHTQTHTHTHACTHTRTHACTHTHSYTHTLTLIYTHTHTATAITTCMHAIGMRFSHSLQ